MTKYIYEKYNVIAQSNGYQAVNNGSSSSTHDGSPYTGYRSYEISNAGTFIGNDMTSISLSGSVYNGGGNTFTRTSRSGNTETNTFYIIVARTPTYSRGSRVGQAIAEDGTLPNDGRHSDGFWYVKKHLATAPILISPNGGETWHESHLIEWSNSQVGLKYRIELSPNNGSSWQTLVHETAVDATSYLYNFINIPETGLALIRVTGLIDDLFTLSGESEGVFTIHHNFPPTMPTNLKPSGVTINRETMNWLEWRHNDPNPNDTQSKADVRWRLQGTTTWNNQTIQGSDQISFYPPNTFPIGVIEWQVRTHDQESLISPWSNVTVFTSSPPTDAPIITSPSTIVGVARPTIQWTSGAQISYQIVITNNLNVTVWDTGEVVSSNKARTVGIDFINGASYFIKVRVKGTLGLWSDYAVRNVSVSYTPPARPIVSAINGDSHISLNIENPIPTGTQPVVVFNDVFKLIDDKWVRIESEVHGEFTDYAVASEENVQYRVRAIGANGTQSESDVAEIKAPKLRGVWLYDVSDPSGTIHCFQFDGDGRSENFQNAHTFRQYAGRVKPVVLFGISESYDVSVSLQISKRNEDRIRLINLIRRKPTLLYRDGRGRKVFGVIPSLPMTDVFYGNTATLNLTEIDYSEEV